MKKSLKVAIYIIHLISYSSSEHSFKALCYIQVVYNDTQAFVNFI